MTDPNNTNNLPNPQDLIDQALAGGGDNSQPTTNEPTPTPATPPITTPSMPSELTQSDSNTTDSTEPAAAPQLAPLDQTNSELPKDVAPAANMPTTEPLTTTSTEPSSELANLPVTDVRGEDVPLSLVGSAPVANDMANDQAADVVATGQVPPMENDNASTVVPPAPEQMMGEKKPKKKGMKIIMGIVGLFIVFGIIGSYSYQAFTGQSLVAVVTEFIPKFVRINGKVVKNPDYVNLNDTQQAINDEARNEYYGGTTVDNQTQKGTDEASCNGCLNGGWMVWRNGSCVITGICNSGVAGKDTVNPMLEIEAQNYNSKDACNNSGKGYVWCESIDSTNKSYAFCNTTGKGCNQVAIEKGYTIMVGALKCVESGSTWVLDRDYYNANNGQGAQSADEVIASYNETIGTPQGESLVDPCSNTYSPAAGEERYICKEGVAGEGGVVYSGGACTALNGKAFTGSLGCFCGTVQVDTNHGHTSYSSTCGCDKEVTTTTFTSSPSPSPSPSPITPTLMCDGLTSTPATTPALGDTVTLTCAGSSSPAGTIDLSYKFRYSVNNGSFAALNNKTATTAEITIAACGDYTVQCQTCGVINGTQVCDPDWSSALVQ